MRPQGAAGGGWADRLIPIILALYLIPALLAVLLVGGIGLLVLAVARGIISIVHGRDARPPEERLKASEG